MALTGLDYELECEIKKKKDKREYQKEFLKYVLVMAALIFGFRIVIGL